MSCTNPDMERLIHLYMHDFLTDDQKIEVEAHLLECEECLMELYRMSPTLELLKNRPELFLDALKPRHTFIAKIRSRIKQSIRAIGKMTIPIMSFILLWWKRPIIKILVPVTITACVLLFILLPSPERFADLAILEKSPYEALQFRGPEQLSPALQNFKSALECYEKDNYMEAIPKFRAFLADEPGNPYGHFYLGVSLSLTSRLDSSMKHLELVARLSKSEGDIALLEKSYWHLGNVFLKSNDEKKAMNTFHALLELKGSLEEKAQSQVDRITKFKNKKSRDEP